MKRNIKILSTLILACTIMFTSGLAIGHFYAAAEPVPVVKKITIDEYHQMINDKESFVVYIGRASCKFCSITSASLDEVADEALPVYDLELEPYYQTPQYDEIKEEFGIYYVPSFKYIEKGELKYHMNPPLNSNYYIEGSDRAAMRKEMIEKIQSFIRGAAGTGPVVDEEVMTDELNAEPVAVGTKGD